MWAKKSNAKKEQDDEKNGNDIFRDIVAFRNICNAKSSVESSVVAKKELEYC